MRYHGATALIVIITVAMLITVSMGSQKRADAEKYGAMHEEQKLQYEQMIEELVIQHQDEIGRIRAEYEHLTPEEIIQKEGEYIAKVLYGYQYNSERDLRTAVWCILNRVDNPAYPDTVQGVCQQENQWIGYSDDNPVLTDLYNIAIKELETWHNNYRPVSAEYVFKSWSSKEFILRDTYKSTNTTKHWQAG